LEAYLAFDATGRVVAWNPAAEATFATPDQRRAAGVW
jgi:PAS domain-containing protein